MARSLEYMRNERAKSLFFSHVAAISVAIGLFGFIVSVFFSEDHNGLVWNIFWTIFSYAMMKYNADKVETLDKEINKLDEVQKTFKR